MCCIYFTHLRYFKFVGSKIWNLPVKEGFIGLQSSIIINDRIIQRFLVSLPMATQLLQILTPAGWIPRAATNGNWFFNHLNTLVMEVKCFNTTSAQLPWETKSTSTSTGEDEADKIKCSLKSWYLKQLILFRGPHVLWISIEWASRSTSSWQRKGIGQGSERSLSVTVTL